MVCDWLGQNCGVFPSVPVQKHNEEGVASSGLFRHDVFLGLLRSRRRWKQTLEALFLSCDDYVGLHTVIVKPVNQRCPWLEFGVWCVVWFQTALYAGTNTAVVRINFPNAKPVRGCLSHLICDVAYWKRCRC